MFVSLPMDKQAVGKRLPYLLYYLWENNSSPSLSLLFRKTFTMTGPPDQRGVNTRALDELFEKARQRSDEWNDTIMVASLPLPLSLLLPLLMIRSMS